jgi:hypothetical protein
MSGTSAAPANYLAGRCFVPTVSGKHEYAVNNPPRPNVTLTAGTTYWILAAFEKSTSSRHRPRQPSVFSAAPHIVWGDALPMPLSWHGAPHFMRQAANSTSSVFPRSARRNLPAQPVHHRQTSCAQTCGPRRILEH